MTKSFRPWKVDEVWLLPAHPLSGQKVAASGRTQLGGGQIATAMVAAVRLGLSAAYAGAGGDDVAADPVLRGLRAEDVDVSAGRRVSGGAPGRALERRPP